jgi:hypothetical protein
MQNNSLITGILAGTLIAIIAGTILLALEYGLFDNDDAVVIVVPQKTTHEVPKEPPEKAPTEAPRTDAPTPSQPEAKPLDFKISYLHRPTGADSFQRLTNSSVLQSRDYYKIIFTPLEDSHVYIFQRDSANKIYQLFPMERFKGIELNNRNPVQGGQTYYIPSQSKSFRLDDQTGTETIYFLASRQPDTALEQEYQQILAAQQHDKAVQQALTTAFIEKVQQKGLKDIKDDPETHSWITEGKEFTVPQQRLEGLNQDSIHILTFQHQ